MEPNDKDNNGVDDSDQEFEKLVDKLMVYQKQIMMGGFIVLFILVVFLGYAVGGLKVCSDLDGLLDSGFKCHPGFYNQTRGMMFDSAGQPFQIPDVIIQNGT